MQKYILVAFFALLTFKAFSQDVPVMEAVDDTWRFQEMKNGRNFIAPKAIAGNPYIEKDFKKGELESKENLHFPPMWLRYNAYTDNIECKTADGKIYALKDQFKISAYKMGDTTFIYTPYFQKKNKVNSGYFQVLVPGKVSGLIRYKVYLIPATPEKPYTPAKPEHFSEISKTFYIKIGQKPATPITTDKSLLKQFPNHQKQLKSFLKKEKIHLQKQEDFAKVVRYLNTL
ncbi:hypothetical protein LA303_08410 [Candidatus Sulfidibacterium hydrothermale]|uniref:hypothetical protein n=1 Tax=Candidatus Sulfidibacterium hydrothermale TaxID=2875962 RepID=UPI001F0AC282|nr:hypothetical protein [Candidatus Sulfidibacterium hydrothermale]UBM61441.1 hypothetical protein LA303_08410 [Candidatus Sulfidibacterium hydrothermale]